MKRFLPFLLLIFPVFHGTMARAQFSAAITNPQISGNAGHLKGNATLTVDSTGNFTAASGSTVNINGVFAGTPTGGTLSLANLTLTLPASFTWSGTLAGANGGTGVANTGKTITMGGNLTTSGAYDTTLTMTGATGITLPTTGTLATLAGAESLTNKKLGSLTSNGVVHTSSGDGTLSASAVSLTADVSGTLPSANGGTGSAFFAVSGPASSVKTFTFPNADSTMVAAGSATSSGLTMATGKLLGRSTASTGAIEEITVGSNLTLSGGTLSATGGGGGGNVSGQAGDTIEITNLSSSPDRTPASPSSEDKEFDSSTIGGTALGSPTTIDANTTVKSFLYVKKAANTGENLTGRYWTDHTFSAGDILVCKLYASTARSDFHSVGVFLGEGTPGKVEAIAFGFSGGARINVSSWTTPTGTYSAITPYTTLLQTRSPVWLAIRYNSSTSLDYFFSYDGISSPLSPLATIPVSPLVATACF
jgi:hypothetical protein